MDEELMGTVKLFAGTYAPRGYMFCAGQLLPIAQYNALFSLLGTTYGGNGTTNFALPNLQGAVAIGQGNGQGTTYVLGQVGGTPNITLTTNNLPAHVHTGMGKISVSSGNATDAVAVEGDAIATPGSVVSRVFTPTLGYNKTTPDVNVISNITTGVTGNNAPLPIMQPYVAMSYIICIEGIYPSRN